MKLSEFEQYNKNKNVPRDWIGQGDGYKDCDFDWDNGDPSDIIYIPEYGYVDEDTTVGNTVERINAYSKNDFINAVREMFEFDKIKVSEKDIDGIAYEVFDTVDWQFPESLLNEWDSLGYFNPESEDYILKKD